MIPILINNRDLLTTVIQQVKFFAQIPHTLICICDNASTYQPLLDWYASGFKILEKLNLKGSGVTLESLVFDNYPPIDADDVPQCWRVNLFRLPENRGPRGSSALLDLIPWPFDHYFLSDADIDYSGVSTSFLYDLMHALDIFPDLDGAGVSLRLNDLPDTKMAEYVRHVEAGNYIKGSTALTGPIVDMMGSPEYSHWCKARKFNKDNPRWYLAPCDTAGVLRRRNPHWQGGYTGVRSAIHIARHIPWYFTPENIPADFAYFFAHANPAGTCYTARVLDNSRPL